MINLAAYYPIKCVTNSSHSFPQFVSMNVIDFSTEVEDKGVEPLTPCLQSRCSSQLS